MILDGCFPGYAFNDTSGQCLPCTATGCDSCSPDTPDKCDGCAVGYWWDEAAQVCAPCAAGCSVCARYKGQQCERCADGYYLERDTRLCKPVSWQLTLVVGWLPFQVLEIKCEFLMYRSWWLGGRNTGLL